MAEMEEYELGRKTIFYIIVAIVLIATAFALVVIINVFKESAVETPVELYTNVYLQRFLGCLAYQDPLTGRIYPGIIDRAKFTDETLNRCYVPNENSVQEFRLELVVDNQPLEVIETENFGIYRTRFPTYVLMHDQGRFQPARLLIGVQLK